MSTDRDNPASFLADCRRRQGWSQAELAEALSTAQSAISDWETGSCEPGIAHFAAWANALGYRLELVRFATDRSDALWLEAQAVSDA